jgi:hypothetical protein
MFIQLFALSSNLVLALTRSVVETEAVQLPTHLIDDKPISELKPFLNTMEEKLRKLQDLNKLFNISEKG